MVKMILNSDNSINTKDLSGKSAVELENILKKCPDYQKCKKLGNAYVAKSGSQNILIYWDDNQHTWVGVPIQTTGGIHCLQADGSYAPKE